MSASYPVRVRATAPTELSRGLWLVKWLLLIPHAVVLFFLWIAFAVLTLVAFVAILVTGRYPASIFEFNVGVLRWSWRVWFYGYYALGTDRYPPFTLHEVPDYPAGLEVDRPEQLSRGLVLVKSWLLAVPHYLVLSFFVGGGLYAAGDSEHTWTWGGGLVVLLTLFAAVALLFTGRYPRSLFDLVVGMDRWVLRVVAYAALMTDRYPPFRLDLGPDDAPPPPDGPTDTDGPAAPVSAHPVPQPTPQPTPPAPAHWTVGRSLALALGCLLVLVGALFGIGGSAVVAVDQTMRDHHGYLMSGTEQITTSSYAVTSEKIDLQVDAGAGSLPRRVLGRVKVTATSVDGTRLFLGIAPTSDVGEYLDGVGHAVVTDFGHHGRGHDAEYRDVAGGPPRALPSATDIWAAHAQGARAELSWEPQRGDWTVVVMNLDGTPAVRADMSAGATVPVLGRGAAVLFSLGAIGLGSGIALLVWAVHAAHRSARPQKEE